ncbi:MAG: leucine-rich repeat domain-containing protein [Prevotellaceae bacterium]|nr:leucine-rich repeat domain-containing protein [Prevotellaceae bacterium]
MKKAILLFAAIVCCMAGWCQDELSPLTFEIDGINYFIDDIASEFAEVVGYSSVSGSVKIPSKVTYDCESYTVKSIGSSAFCVCKMTSISIPSTVTDIGSYAFYDCIELASVSLPSSLERIGDYAFDNCGNLNSITIPDNVVYIGNAAFTYSGLTSIDLSANLTSISDATFRGCGNLNSITIPSSVKSTGFKAFNECRNLKYVVCNGNTPPSLGGYAFEECGRLSLIIVPSEAVDAYKSNWGDVKDKIFSFDSYKESVLAEIYNAMKGAEDNAFLNELVAAEIMNITNATTIEVIDSNKNAAIAKLTDDIVDTIINVSKNIFGTKADGPAVKVMKGERTVIFYRPDKVEYFKATTKE